MMRTRFWHVFVMVGLGLALATSASSAAEGGELKVGDQAPEFTLKGSDGQTYTLSQFRGKQPVVLAWFPKAFTGGCTAECKSFRENDEIKALDVAYFTASVDDEETNTRFAESLDLDYPILSDPSREAAKAYGVVEDDQGFAKRWTFYIDQDGVIRHIDKQVRTAESAPDVVAKLKELGLVSG